MPKTQISNAGGDQHGTKYDIVLKMQNYYIKFNFTLGLHQNRDSSTFTILPGPPSKIVVLRSVVSLNHLYTLHNMMDILRRTSKKCTCRCHKLC